MPGIFGQWKAMAVNMVNSNCVICGTPMLVNQMEFNDMAAHVCAICYARPVPSSVTLPYAIASTPSIEEFEAELEKILTNSELGFEDMPGWSITETKEKSCECGSTVAGSPSHSDWCPLYIDLFKGAK